MQQHFYNVSHGLMVLHNVDFIYNQYSEYIARVYKDAIVAFDSYENMNRKSRHAVVCQRSGQENRVTHKCVIYANPLSHFFSLL